MRRLVIVVIILAGAAAIYVAARTALIPDRYNPLAPLDLSEPPGAIADWKLWLMADDLPACMAALRRQGVEVKAMPRQIEATGCLREDTVTISRFSAAAIGAEEMRCSVALRLYLLERHVVQPLALRHFGSRVERIDHFGSYSCRNIAGRNRLSEHATANAFDISGFVLAGGRSMSVRRNWNQGGAPSQFLRDVRLGACSLFNLVLSPDYNEAHADHFHVDMGLFRGCN